MPKNRRIAVMLNLEWPYKRHSGVFAGTQQYAEEQDWHSIIDEFAHDTLPARASKSIPYDGVIARANPQLAERANRLGVPVVNIWNSSPARDLLPGVFVDWTVVGRMCAEHLLARGFRNFAAVTSPKNVGHDITVREFTRLVGEVGFACLTEKVPQTLRRDLASWRKTERVIARLLEACSPPIGIYVGQEEVGRMIVQACHERGWRVPIDVALIAGQNEETLCEHPRPSLTSVEIGYERIGYEAARLLHRLMDEKDAGAKKSARKKDTPRSNKRRSGPGPHVDQTLLAPKCLVVRESTDFFAVEDELVAAALAFIAANSHRKIGQDDVARAVGAETRTLQLRFRKFLDRPIVTEIRRVRIERAKRELTQTKRRLSEIAHEVGFGETMRMYEVFRRELGVTPSQYRKQRQVRDDL